MLFDPPSLGAKEAGGIPDSSSWKEAASASATVPLEPPEGCISCLVADPSSVAQRVACGVGALSSLESRAHPS